MSPSNTSKSGDLLADIADEFPARCRADDSPSIDDYARKYPHLADRIRRLFPTLAALERGGPAFAEQQGELG